jgi:cytochrome P450
MITRFFVDVACDLPERRAGALFLEFATAAVSWVGQIIPSPAIMDGPQGQHIPALSEGRVHPGIPVHLHSSECDSQRIMPLDRSNVVDVDLGSAEFKANAHRHMAEWARRRPFYVLGNGPPQVIVGRYADVHRVFSETETFKSEMPRGPGWEQFNKVMFAQFVTQMDGEQHARVRRLLLPAFSSRRIEQLEESITRIVDGMLDRIEANGPEFDGMQDYGAHLVVDALLDAMVDMDKRRKAIFVAFHNAIPGTTYVKPGESWSPELRRAFDRTMEEVRAIIE